MENIVVAFSNIVALFPIMTTIKHNDYLTTLSLIFVFLMSLLSHLIENHKHGMPGVGFSTTASYFMNRLDVLGCFIVIIRMLYIFYQVHQFRLVIIYQNVTLFLCAAIIFAILQISEFDKYNSKLRNQYIITHCIWHIGIFYIIDQFLVRVIYL